MEQPRPMLKLESVKNTCVKRFLGHIVYLTISATFIPLTCYFELFIVQPYVVELFSLKFWIHFSLCTFLFINVVGNMMYGMFTDSSTRKNISLSTNSNSDWKYCKVCDCVMPPRTWHCKICNKCCLKRDHHCYYFANCIGYYNERYYIMFLVYCFIASVYAVVYNVYFLTQFLTGSKFIVFLKIVFPFVSLVINFGTQSLYVILVFVHITVAFSSGVSTLYDLKLLFIGKTRHENKSSKNNSIYNKGWQSNLIESLGTRWYLTWIIPCIDSPLPGNGVEWELSNRNE